MASTMMRAVLFLLLAWYGTQVGPAPAFAAGGGDDLLSGKFAELEARLDARLGAAVLDTETGRRWSYRADERFPLNSTFKAYACAGLLARVDAGEEDLERRMVVRPDAVVSYSPVAGKRTGGEGMTLAELCSAAVTLSDNTAGNLVLDVLGGPEGFTAFMRRIGDPETRLDRREPDLNEAKPGDSRDTTTPTAAVNSLQALVAGPMLSEDSRRLLEAWLADDWVGGPLLRAGLPAGWRIGDKTGAGGYGSRSVVAVIRPPERKPVFAAIYITGTAATMDERNAAIAEIGAALATVVVR